MSHRKLTALFFAGTDTGAGKTYTAALAARWLRASGIWVAVYKPVESGCRTENGKLVPDDASLLWEAAGRPKTLDQVCPQRFAAPLSPPQAAAAERKSVDAGLLRSAVEPWREFDMLIIEGAGGLFSPIADNYLNIELARDLNADVIVVAANRLGVIHQVIATCTAASHHGIQPVGIVLCNVAGELDVSVESNADQISNLCSTPILGTIPHGATQSDVGFLEKLLRG